MYHIPVMVGGIFSHYDAEQNFEYFNQLTTALKAVGQKRFNINIEGKFSTADEFLDAIASSKTTEYPVVRNKKDFFPSLKNESCDTCSIKNPTSVVSQIGYVSNYAELKQAIETLSYEFRMLVSTLDYIDSAES